MGRIHTPIQTMDSNQASAWLFIGQMAHGKKAIAIG
jgi:hypothetical protein